MKNSLDLNQSPFIEEIHQGYIEDGFFLIRKMYLNTGKTKKPFLRIILADKTGHLPAVYFGAQKELTKLAEEIIEGDIVRISGIMEEFRDVLQIKLIKMEKAETKNLEMTRFWKRTPHDRRELFREIRTMVQSIQNPKLKNICLHFLKQRNFLKIFLEAPASRFVHHAYIGGLLEHTRNVMQIATAFTHIYKDADRDLMITGGFLHDIGKIDEYKFLYYEIDHSDEGKLKGHTLLGYEKLLPALNQADLDKSTRLKLEHMVLSQQGKRVWGAIEEPRFTEAYLLHAADSTDASEFIYSDARRKHRRSHTANPEKHYWSDYISAIGRDVYLG